eukprot:1814722-Pyramimonas_sp.AAC.1
MRALSLLSVISKWFHSCLIILAAPHLRSTTPGCMLDGFAGERRVHEVTAVVERLAQRGVEWGKFHACCFASLDVLRAFDHLTVNSLSESMDALSPPPTWPMLYSNHRVTVLQISNFRMPRSWVYHGTDV